MRPEVITILKALTNKNPSAITIEKRTLEMLAERQDVLTFIDELKKEIRITKDSHDDRVPFYDFYLAVALFRDDDIEEAKDFLSNAVLGFRILGWTLNEALGEWLFSIIHFEDEDYERAQIACNTASSILRSLITQYEKVGKYEGARELTAYLIQLSIFQDNIVAAIDSFTTLKDSYTKLKNEFEHLQRRNRKIPPTLVAKIFYLSKILMPAHYIYPPPPEPETDREESIYSELLHKVGFFKIIEQLVELEKQFVPTATREELLDRINKAWDVDVKQ